MARRVHEISDALSSMRFMQRGINPVALKKKSITIDNERWRRRDDNYFLELNLFNHAKDDIVLVDYIPDEDCSYINKDDYVIGRRSYQNFNSKVEKMMRAIEGTAEEDLSNETSVSENEMAERYSSLVGTISNKFAKNRKRNIQTDDDVEDNKDTITENKRVFLKPKD